MMQSGQAPLWHTLDVDAVLAEVAVTRDGLTADEARKRLERYGPNRLEVTPPASAWSILVAQFRSVVVLLLVAAAALSIAFGDIADAVAVAAVLVINAALGFVTEFRARRAMDALRGLEVPREPTAMSLFPTSPATPRPGVSRMLRASAIVSPRALAAATTERASK